MTVEQKIIKNKVGLLELARLNIRLNIRDTSLISLITKQKSPFLFENRL